MLNLDPLRWLPHFVLRTPLCPLQFKTSRSLLFPQFFISPINLEHHTLRRQEIREAPNTHSLLRTSVKFLRTSSKKETCLYVAPIGRSHPQPESLYPDLSSHSPTGSNGIFWGPNTDCIHLICLTNLDVRSLDKCRVAAMLVLRCSYLPLILFILRKECPSSLSSHSFSGSPGVHFHFVSDCSLSMPAPVVC